MRNLCIILAVVLAAGVVNGRPQHVTMSAATGTNTTATATDSTLSGYIDEIFLEAPSGVTSGIVSVVATQPLGNTVTLASKAVTADTLVRIRVDGTDTAGSALTSDPPGRYLTHGDTITLTVTAADPTGLTWRVWIKYDDWK